MRRENADEVKRVATQVIPSVNCNDCGAGLDQMTDVDRTQTYVRPRVEDEMRQDRHAQPRVDVALHDIGVDSTDDNPRNQTRPFERLINRSTGPKRWLVGNDR